MSTTSSTASVATTAAPTSFGSQGGNSESLSTGAKIGIGVAAGVAGLLGMALLVISIRLGRQKRAARAVVAEEAIGDGKPELDGRNMAAVGGGMHLPVHSQELVEVDNGTPRIELGGNPRAELDGSSRIY